MSVLLCFMHALTLPPIYLLVLLLSLSCKMYLTRRRVRLGLSFRSLSRSFPLEWANRRAYMRIDANVHQDAPSLALEH